jgi:transcriptional regulator with XRE-family HTH domain
MPDGVSRRPAPNERLSMTHAIGTISIHQDVKPGESLRRLRMRLGLSTRKVAELSLGIAAKQGSREFSISHTRLVQIENQGSIPSIHKLFTLSCVYGIAVQELFSVYFNPQEAGQLHACMPLPNTHLSSFGAEREPNTIAFPAHPRSTSPAYQADVLSGLIQARGEAPVPLLEYFNRPKSRYAFIGLSDHTMSPLIPPGSVVQIEECSKIAKFLPYRTEWERPVYFLESRSGYLCSWCDVRDGQLLSIPHPLSPCRPQVFNFPSEVEVIGRVTGVALRCGAPDAADLGAEANRPEMETRIEEREKATAG